MPPIAPAVPKIAKINTDVSKISWANKINVAAVIAPKPFKHPKIIAIGRSSSCFQSQVKPSFISALKLRAFFSAWGFTGRAIVAKVAIKAAETKKVAVSK